MGRVASFICCLGLLFPVSLPAPADDLRAIGICIRLDSGRELLRHRHLLRHGIPGKEIPCTEAHLEAAEKAFAEQCTAEGYRETLICTLQEQALVDLETRLWKPARK